LKPPIVGHEFTNRPDQQVLATNRPDQQVLATNRPDQQVLATSGDGGSCKFLIPLVVSLVEARKQSRRLS